MESIESLLASTRSPATSLQGELELDFSFELFLFRVFFFFFAEVCVSRVDGIESLINNLNGNFLAMKLQQPEKLLLSAAKLFKSLYEKQYEAKAYRLIYRFACQGVGRY